MTPSNEPRAPLRRGLLAAAVLALAQPALPSSPPLAGQEPGADRAGAERVTVSFEATPLGEVLRVFAGASGRSIVLGAGLGDARVTAEIQDQPWDAALRAILEAHGLSARETETGIIQVVPRSSAAAAPSTVSRVFRIQYARAAEIASAIQPHLTPGLGAVSILPAANAVVVTDTPDGVSRAARLIGRPGGEPDGG